MKRHQAMKRHKGYETMDAVVGLIWVSVAL
jgi:hypothetical protein